MYFFSKHRGKILFSAVKLVKVNFIILFQDACATNFTVIYLKPGSMSLLNVLGEVKLWKCK